MKGERVKKPIKIAIILMLVGGLLTTAAFLMAFNTAEVQTFGTVNLTKAQAAASNTVFEVAPANLQPIDGTINYLRPWFSQKIFYFHVPFAEASFLIFTVAAFFAVMFLSKRRKSFDTKSRIAMEVAFLFVVATMITGDLWTRASWGMWWDWEPRLTTYLIMMLLMLVYFVLRNSIEDEERRAMYASVFCIIAWIDAPISFFITRIIPSQHPVVFKSGMATSNLVPFIVAQVGMIMIGYAIYTLRVGEEQNRERLEIIKEAIEN